MKIYAFHLLNDYSGSPKVLSQILKGLVKKKADVVLVCSKSDSGFLDNLEGVTYVDNKYRFRQNILLRLIQLFYVQFYMCYKLYRQVKKEDVIYVNTVLPFGAAVLGKLKGCRIVYHLHESSMKPVILKRFLFFFVKTMADEVIYVSQFLAAAEKMKVSSSVVYNSLEQSFLRNALASTRIIKDKKTILMICSLKAYKGVHEFISLAKSIPTHDFQLILNATQEEIDTYFLAIDVSDNVQLFPKQSKVASFYAKADLVMNLSRPDQWVETFGLTALEGMAYGVPCIVPEVGGIAEIVSEGETGFKISCYNLSALRERIESLFSKPKVLLEMRENCLKHVQLFSEAEQVLQVHSVLQGSPS